MSGMSHGTALHGDAARARITPPENHKKVNTAVKKSGMVR